MWYLILCLRGLDISFFLSVFHTGFPSHRRMISISSLGADSSFYLLACLFFLVQLMEFGVPTLDVLRQRMPDLPDLD